MSDSKDIILKILKRALLSDMVIADNKKDNLRLFIGDILDWSLSKTSKRDINKLIRDNSTEHVSYRFSHYYPCINSKAKELLSNFIDEIKDPSISWKSNYSFKDLKKRREFNFEKNKNSLYKAFLSLIVNRLFRKSSDALDDSILKYSLSKGNGIFLYYALKNSRNSYRYDFYLMDKKVQRRLSDIFLKTKDIRLKNALSKEIRGVDNIISCLNASKDFDINSSILINLKLRLTKAFLRNPIKFLNSNNLDDLLEMMSNMNGYKYQFRSIYWQSQAYCIEEIIVHFSKLRSEKQKIDFALKLYKVLSYSDSFGYFFEKTMQCALEVVVSNLKKESVIYLMGYKDQEQGNALKIIKNKISSVSNETYF